MIEIFLLNFYFESDDTSINEALHSLKDKIFAPRPRIFQKEVPLYTFHQHRYTTKKLVECYVVLDEINDDEDPRDIYILESKVKHKLFWPQLDSNSLDYTKPLKM